MWVLGSSIHIEIVHGHAHKKDTDSSPYCVIDDDIDCLQNIEMEGNEL